MVPELTLSLNVHQHSVVCGGNVLSLFCVVPLLEIRQRCHFYHVSVAPLELSRAFPRPIVTIVPKAVRVAHTVDIVERGRGGRVITKTPKIRTTIVLMWGGGGLDPVLTRLTLQTCSPPLKTEWMGHNT